MLGPLQSKTTCECGLSLKTDKGTTLTQAGKKNLKWKIGSGFVERTHPYASEIFKWKVGDQDAQIGETLDLKKRETGRGFSEEEYQINLEHCLLSTTSCRKSILFQYLKDAMNLKPRG